MWNYICNAYVRNDGNPSIAMSATLFSSLFNIVFDYILMFPLGLSMEGAALATAFSPIIGIAISLYPFSIKKEYDPPETGPAFLPQTALLFVRSAFPLSSVRFLPGLSRSSLIC